MWVAAESSANQSDQEGRAFSKEFLSPADPDPNPAPDPDPAAHLKKVSGIHTLLRSIIVRYLGKKLYTLQLYLVDNFSQKILFNSVDKF